MAVTDARGPREWSAEAQAQAQAMDRAVFDAVASTPTPSLDRFFVGLSDAADRSRLWLVAGSVVAVVGGERGRRAAVEGVVAIGMASAVSNLVLKPLARRRRPWVQDDGVVVADSRRVRRPASDSFPSGHAASAFAFASAMGEAAPPTWLPLHVAAGLVGYSRVHTGVHYPSDVIVGALVGDMCAWTTRRGAGWLASARTKRR